MFVRVPCSWVLAAIRSDPFQYLCPTAGSSSWAPPGAILWVCSPWAGLGGSGAPGVLGCLPLPGAPCHSSLELSPKRGGKGQRLINWKSLQAARNVVCRKFILLLHVERSDYLGIGSFPHCCAISVTQIGAGAEGCWCNLVFVQRLPKTGLQFWAEMLFINGVGSRSH